MNKNITNIALVKNVILVSALLIIVFLIIHFLLGNVKIPLTEILTSWIICIVNFVSGVEIFLFSFSKPAKQFMLLSLGSIALRLFLLIILVVVLITVFKFQINYFILSLLGFYFIYLIFEIYLLNKFAGKSKG